MYRFSANVSIPSCKACIYARLIAVVWMGEFDVVR